MTNNKKTQNMAGATHAPVKTPVSKGHVPNLYEKIFLAKQSIGALIKEKDNPYFKSKYIDINGVLEAIKQAFIDNRLLLLQPLVSADGKTYLYTRIIDIDEEGEEINTSCLLPETSDAQKMGSIITYFRRYALVSMLSLEADDDDGNDASEGKDTTPPLSVQPGASTQRTDAKKFPSTATANWN